jgi:hypothetical protein
MRQRSLFKVLILCSLITLTVALIAVLVELWRSLSFGMTSGIGFVAGGFSEMFIALMVIGLPVVFALTYFLLTPKGPGRAKRARKPLK